jgi:Extensin-like protein C-terminus
VAVLYRVSFKAASEKHLNDWLRAEGLGQTMERVRDRMKKQEGPWRQRDRGEDWGPRRPYAEALDTYREALSRNKEGDIRMMTPEKPDGALIAARKIQIPDVKYPTISGNATPAAKAIVKPLWTEFPGLDYWGCYNCRRISGSSSWSQHAWADAIDVHAPSMAYGDQVYRWLMSNRGKFKLTRVLWRVPNHYDHLHIDFDPDRSGTPPCA